MSLTAGRFRVQLTLVDAVAYLRSGGDNSRMADDLGWYELIKLIGKHDYAKLDVALTAARLGELDRDGCSWIMNALFADAPSVKMIEYLIARGVPVEAADKQGWTALHVAARDHREAIIRILLRAGASVDAIDTVGNTPLLQAMNPDVPLAVIELLIEAGADPARKNHHDVSPLDTALRMKRDDLVRALRGEKSAPAPAPEPQPYSVKAKFAVGDRIRHPTFGVGVVGKLFENKIEVDFVDEGRRILLHDRK